MKYPHTLAASKSPEITALVDGMSVVGNGYFFTEEMLNNIEAALAGNPDQAARILQLEQQLQQAEAGRTMAVNSLAAANNTIIERDAEITRLNEELNGAGGEFENTKRDKDAQGKEEVGYHLSDENPANQIADSLLGKPKAKTTA